MKKIILGLILATLFLPSLAMAYDPGNWVEWMNNSIEGSPIRGKTDLIGIVFHAIQYILAFLGVVAVVIIIYAGFTWMTAAGNDEKVGKAKKTLMAGVIGLMIILLAYAIAGFVVQRLEDFAGTEV